MKTSRCRSCGAEIIWAIDPEGRRLPLNARRVRTYTLKDGGGDPHADPGKEPAYVSHFLTCPQATQWSGGKKASPGGAT